MDRIRTAFAALKIPCYRAWVIISRGKKSGHNPWQQDHQKAMDAKRGVLKRGKYTSILDRRCIPSVSIGTLLDWRAGQVPRLHLQDWHIMMHLTDSDYDMKAQSAWEASIPINKQDHCVNDLIIKHQQMLLSAFNELKAKKYLRFQCFCAQDLITHWIPQSNNTKNGWVSTGRRISRHLLPQHGQEAQRGGVLHLGTINGKNGTLKGGKPKNGTSDNNDNARVTLKLASGNCRRAKKVSVVVKFTWIRTPCVVLRTSQICLLSGSFAYRQ